jgi:hypothetical protein
MYFRKYYELSFQQYNKDERDLCTINQDELALDVTKRHSKINSLLQGTIKAQQLQAKKQ